MKSETQICKEKSKKTFDAQAKDYDTTYNGKHARKLYQIVLEKLKQLPYSSVLDVGCGTGSILSMIPTNRNIKLTGIDFSGKMIDIARERLSGSVELKVGDSENLPWGDSTFDVIMCTDSFHHYPKPERVLNEMGRVLKNQGRLIIADPWMSSPLRQLSNLVLKYGNSGDFRIYSRNEMTNLLKLQGFNLISWELVNPNSFILTASKSNF